MSEITPLHNPLHFSEFFFKNIKEVPPYEIQSIKLDEEFDHEYDQVEAIIDMCYEIEAAQPNLRYTRDHEKMMNYYEDHREDFIKDPLNNSLFVARSKVDHSILGASSCRFSIDDALVQFIFNHKTDSLLAHTAFTSYNKRELRQWGHFFVHPYYERQGIGSGEFIKVVDHALEQEATGIIDMSSWKGGQRYQERHLPGTELGTMKTPYGPPGIVHFFNLESADVLKQIDSIRKSDIMSRNR